MGLSLGERSLDLPVLVPLNEETSILKAKIGFEIYNPHYKYIFSSFGVCSLHIYKLSAVCVMFPSVEQDLCEGF